MGMEDIVANAVKEAETGEPADEAIVDTGEKPEGQVPEGEEHAAEAEGEEAAKVGAEAEKPTADDEELNKLLLELGVKPPKEGERENRLPHKAVKRLIGNAVKKLKAIHEGQLTEHTTKLTAAERELQSYRLSDQVAATKPEQFLQALALRHPELYGKYVTPAEKKEAAVEAKADADDPMPPPDGKLPDGTPAYTPEGWVKYMDWRDRQVERRVTKQLKDELKKDYDARLSPLEKDLKAKEFLEQERPKIAAQWAAAEKRWGKVFTDEVNKGNDGELVKMLNANDGKEGRPYVSFRDAVETVLLPKIQAERNTMRAEIMAELKAAPSAAAGAAPAAVKAEAAVAGERTTEDIVREAIRAASR